MLMYGYYHVRNITTSTADPQNMGIDTSSVDLRPMVTEILQLVEFPLMAVRISILCKFPNGARVASLGFLIRTLSRYRNCKKKLGEPYCMLLWSTAGLYTLGYTGI